MGRLEGTLLVMGLVVYGVTEQRISDQVHSVVCYPSLDVTIGPQQTRVESAELVNESYPHVRGVEYSNPERM